jgi:hypothetical protein
MVVQNAGELPPSVRDALRHESFEVEYVEGFANASKSVIEARPGPLVIDIESWAKNVEELLREFATCQKPETRRLGNLFGDMLPSLCRPSLYLLPVSVA